MPEAPVPFRRRLIWGFLVAALLGVVAVALWSRLHHERPAPPPPILGQVPAFTFTNRDGRPISRETLAGAPWVADFVFTRCPSSCPLMTAEMARFDRSLPARAKVHLVSFSVDPTHDTPEVLARYAAAVRAADRWLFLTGPEAALRQLSREGFKLAVGVPPPGGSTVAGGRAPEPILHSTLFVLIDGQARIRGYYDGLDPEAVGRLRRDLQMLE
ncbi:MAG TPA: SCO family protein [Thermoanaerobaculia bacterium]|nr:SCO family protein [Thermoanaerobaculia bacterium]